MNQLQWFDTYRKCSNLQKVYQDIYNIDNSKESINQSLATCIDYFLKQWFIPDSLVYSISKTFFERINAQIKINNNINSELINLINNYIFLYTYESPSSTMVYFLERLHIYCDYLEKKPLNRVR